MNLLPLLGQAVATTTLRMINRMIEATDGTIEMNGKNVRNMNPVELRRSIGYVIQQIG